MIGLMLLLFMRMSKFKHTKSFCWLEDNSSKSLLLNFTDSAVDSQNEYNVLIMLGIYVTLAFKDEKPQACKVILYAISSFF